MPYRLSADRLLVDEVRRVAAEEFATAISNLTKKDQKQQPKAIHEARKSLKKLRALLRLLRPNLPSAVVHDLNTGLRDTARTLSKLRDAHAMQEAFESLVKEETLDADTLATARERLKAAADRAEEHVHPSAALPEAAKSLRRLRTQWKSIELPAFATFEWLEPGLKKIYKRGRKRMVAAEREGTPEALHEWRKRVKDHWYQARLLSTSDHEIWRTRVDDLKTLEGLLGDDHNLILIEQVIGDRDKALKPLTKLIHDRSRKLQDDASVLGDQLYASKWSKVREHLPATDQLWQEVPTRKQPGKAAQKRTAGKARTAVA